MPHTFVCPHTFICPLDIHTPPYAPIVLCASVCSQRFCMLWGVVSGSLCVRTLSLHHPYMGVPPSFASPTLNCCFPVHWYVLGILVCYVGICPSLQLGGFGRHQYLRCPHAHPCYFFSALCLTFLLCL